MHEKPAVLRSSCPAVALCHVRGPLRNEIACNARSHSFPLGQLTPTDPVPDSTMLPKVSLTESYIYIIGPPPPRPPPPPAPPPPPPHHHHPRFRYLCNAHQATHELHPPWHHYLGIMLRYWRQRKPIAVMLACFNLRCLQYRIFCAWHDVR